MAGWTGEEEPVADAHDRPHDPEVSVWVFHCGGCGWLDWGAGWWADPAQAPAGHRCPACGNQGGPANELTKTSVAEALGDGPRRG